MSRVGQMRRDLYLRRLAASTAPIFVGPYHSELGFEVSYWLPWVAKWRERFGIDRDRLIPISRGGAGIWYDTPRRVELFDHFTVEQLRQRAIQTYTEKQSVKQNAMDPWETRFCALAADLLGLRRYHVLHPSLMYQDLHPWFDAQMGLGKVLQRLAYPPVTVPPVPLTLTLPEKFLAVKFYARSTWEPSEDLKDWVSSLVETLSRSIPVVLLDGGVDADDHFDFPIALSERVTSTAPACTPQTNLAVQSAVLAKASAFIGTYGGMQQLALRLGKPSAGFYTDFKGTCYAHKLLNEYTATQAGLPLFIGKPAGADFIKQAMGGQPGVMPAMRASS